MKKIIFYFFVAMCVSITTVSAQTFQNVTGTRNNSELGNCAATDADGSLLVGGHIFIKPFSFIPLLVSFNADGTVGSKFILNDMALGFKSIVAIEALKGGNGEANGYIIVLNYSNNVVVVRVNKYNKVVWSKILYSVSPGRGKVIQPAYIPVTKKLNGFYLTVVENASEQVLIKFSGEGTILWQKKIVSPEDDYAFAVWDIAADDDGGCMVAGNLDLETQKPVLMKFSPMGRLLWGKRYNFFNSVSGAGVTALAKTNNGYILSGSESKASYDPNLTFKVNKLGDIVWANNYSIPYGGNAPRKIITDSNGNILFAGPSLYQGDTARSPYMVKLDSMGNIVFGKQFVKKMVLNDIALAPDGYYAAGNIDPETNNTDLYVIKTNAAGNTGGSCTTTDLNFAKTPTEYKKASTPEYEITDDTLTANNIVLTTEKYLPGFPQNRCGTGSAAFTEIKKQAPLNNLSVSPNPTRGIVSAAYNSTVTSRVQLNVYDKTGKLMFTKTEQAVKGKNTYQLNLSNLINGIYNLQMINGSEQSRVMFVIEK